MFMLEQRVQQQFFENADLQNQAAELLARPVAEAAEAIAACITSGGKLMVAGSEAGALLVPLVPLAFVGRFERERPPLAALALRAEPTASLAQQITALGQPGDLLLLIEGVGSGQVLHRAAQAAQHMDMSVIVLTGAERSAWQELLSETDAVLAVPHDRAARVAETQMLVLHCLCDAVDLQLMGEQESL
jgi:D-sedoheptulose 7-phosphate isomerase